MEVTFSLPDDLYQQVERRARESRRGVTDLLSETLRMSLSCDCGVRDALPEVSELCDKDLLDVAGSRLAPAPDERLSMLLEGQERGTLSLSERYELEGLLKVYCEGLLRKALAVQEAARRGLSQPPAP